MKKLCYLAAVLLLLGSCKKNKSDQTTGNINGKVTQHDQYWESTDLNKVSVWLDNDIVTTTTDDQGYYALSGVKPGIYTIFFAKPGCETFRIEQVNFPGNGTLYRDAVLNEIPTFQFQSADIKAKISDSSPRTTFTINLKMSPNSRTTHATAIFGFTDALDINQPGSYRTAYTFTVPANTSDFNLVSPELTIWINPNAANQDLYARVYPCGISTYGTPLPLIKIK